MEPKEVKVKDEQKKETVYIPLLSEVERAASAFDVNGRAYLSKFGSIIVTPINKIAGRDGVTKFINNFIVHGYELLWREVDPLAGNQFFVFLEVKLK